MKAMRIREVGAVAASGLLLFTAPAGSAQTAYTYDELGRLSTTSYSNGAVVTYTYDAAGNRTQKAVVAPSAPTVAAVSASVAFNTATVITLSVSGSYTSVAVPSGPSHGSVSISGTAITYTPATNYSGSDSFSYTATNSVGTSSAATVSITVSSSAFTQTIQISGSGPVNLRTLANTAGYSGAQNANITFEVGSGVAIMGDPGGGIGLDTGTWPGGYTITLALTVKSGGGVYGGGGNGGAGGGPWFDPPGSGGTGGDAIYARVPISVTVQSGGTVAGGGNGGDGGAGVDWWDPYTSTDYYLGGGGGGGGFPNGSGGAGGVSSNSSYYGTEGYPGSDGSVGGAGGPGQDYNLNFAQGGGNGAGAGYWGYAIRKNGNTVSLSNSGTVSGTVN